MKRDLTPIPLRRRHHRSALGYFCHRGTQGRDHTWCQPTGDPVRLGHVRQARQRAKRHALSQPDAGVRLSRNGGDCGRDLHGPGEFRSSIASKGSCRLLWTSCPLIILSLAGALIGFGFVGLATRKFLSDPTLPAPEAKACKTMIGSAVAHAAMRPRMGQSLFAALLIGAGTTLMVKMHALAGSFSIFSQRRNDHDFAFRLPLDALLIGIGGLLTLPTALLVFGGAMVRMVGEFFIAGLEPGSVWATERFAGDIDTTLRWAGGATMLVAVCYSLVRFMGIKKLHGSNSEDDQVLEVDPGIRRMLKLSIGLGVLVLVGWLVMASGIGAFAVTMAITILVMAMLMTTLGAILSLQVGSSASPVSGTIFVTTLVLCLAALALGHRQVEDVLILTPLMVGACVAVCSANDSSQDYKTMPTGRRTGPGRVPGSDPRAPGWVRRGPDRALRGGRVLRHGKWMPCPHRRARCLPP